MQRDWMQCIPCSLVKCNRSECSGFHKAWLNAGDSMQHDWMQCTPFSVVNCIPIECSGFHAAWLNAEDSMHCGVMDPDCMQRSPCSVMTEWIPCSLLKCILIECSVFHAAWRNGTLLNAVDFIQHDWMQWIPCSKLNAVYFMQYGPKHPYRTQWIPCILSAWNVIHAAL